MSVKLLIRHEWCTHTLNVNSTNEREEVNCSVTNEAPLAEHGSMNCSWDLSNIGNLLKS